jgi:hypothetical protein
MSTFRSTIKELRTRAKGNANPNEKAGCKWRVDHNDKSTSQFDPGWDVESNLVIYNLIADDRL